MVCINEEGRYVEQLVLVRWLSNKVGQDGPADARRDPVNGQALLNLMRQVKVGFEGGLEEGYV